MIDPPPAGGWPPWLGGALISVAGVLIGSLALAVFCYALGLNFSDQGWAGQTDDAWQQNRSLRLGSFVGFAVAILMFWYGVIRSIRKTSSTHG